MKNFLNIFIFAVAVFTVYSCAVEPDAVPNEDQTDEFEAWRNTYFPEAEGTPLGVYILKENGTDTDGSAASADDAGYIKVNYVVRDLKGQISSSNTMEIAKQLGNCTSEADYVNYYGPMTWNRTDNSISIGLKELLSGMKEGETRYGAIPGWLATTASYSNEEEYRKNVTGNSHSIYELTIEEIIASADKKKYKSDMDKWQIDQMTEFIGRHTESGYDNPMPGFEDWTFDKAILDTVWTEDKTSTYMGSVYGFYFDNGEPLVKDPETDKTDSVAFAKTDTTFTINYTGRRLLPKYNEKGTRIDGEYDEQIFDTTIEKLAKDAGIYSAGRTYGPVKVTWSESASGIQLGGSTVIKGFYTALWNMQYKHKIWEEEEKESKVPSKARKAVAIFYSPYGYGANGSGSLIPGYAPLMFEIEIIKEEKED